MKYGRITALIIGLILMGPLRVPTHAGAIGAPGVLNPFAAKEITLPAGTTLPIVLDTSVSSQTSRVEQPVRGHVSRNISRNGVIAVPAGSEVYGVVTDVRRSAKVKGRAHIGIRFNTLVPKGSTERYRIQTAAIGRTAPATKKNDG